MMHTVHFLLKTAAWVLLFTLIAGCRGVTPPVQFFKMNAPVSGYSQKEEFFQKKDLVLGIGPLILPQYLERSQIVTRSGENRLVINEFHRWAGTLEDEFMRVLMQNISFLTGTDNIEVYPFHSNFKPHYIITLKVFTFEGSLGDSVLLDCVWNLTSPGNGMTATHSTLIEEPSPGGYGELVAAKSRAVGRLSREIVEEITKTN